MWQLLPMLAQDAAFFRCTIIKMSFMSAFRPYWHDISKGSSPTVGGRFFTSVRSSRSNSSPGQNPREGEYRDYSLRQKTLPEKNCGEIHLPNPQAPQLPWGIRNGQNDSCEIDQSRLPAALCCIGMYVVRNQTVQLLLSGVFWRPFLLLNKPKHLSRNPHRLEARLERPYMDSGGSLQLSVTITTHECDDRIIIVKNFLQCIVPRMCASMSLLQKWGLALFLFARRLGSFMPKPFASRPTIRKY